MSLMAYRFVGSVCDLGNGTLLNQFGQMVELEPADADKYILRGAALISEADFQAAGITDKELASYPLIEMQPPEFAAKRNAVWQTIHNHRESLKAEVAQ